MFNVQWRGGILQCTAQVLKSENHQVAGIEKDLGAVERGQLVGLARVDGERWGKRDLVGELKGVIYRYM